MDKMSRKGGDSLTTFTASGAIAGAKQGLPLALSIFAYGAVFGVLARQTGMSLVESLSMSGFVVAGSAQFVVLELWGSPLPVFTILFTTLVVNLRHILMGAALQPWFSHVSPLQAYVSVFFMGDENWALSIRELKNGGTDAAFLLGGGIVFYIAWLSATGTGYLAGAFVQDPARWGLDFAFLAAFLALLAGMWSGKSDLLPWLVAAGLAVITAHWLPGKWYILVGGIGGSLLGALIDAE